MLCKYPHYIYISHYSVICKHNCFGREEKMRRYTYFMSMVHLIICHEKHTFYSASRLHSVCLKIAQYMQRIQIEKLITSKILHFYSFISRIINLIRQTHSSSNLILIGLNMFKRIYGEVFVSSCAITHVIPTLLGC